MNNEPSSTILEENPSAGVVFSPPRSVFRMLRYIVMRFLALISMVFLGAYLSVVFVNYGGYIDELYRGRIDEMLVSASVQWVGLPPEEIAKNAADFYTQMEKAFGIDTPFLVRSAKWTWDGMTFQWEERHNFKSLYRRQTASVKEIILERLPNTFLLSGLTNFCFFFVAIFTALALSRRYGSLLDRFFVTFSTFASIPNWAYGVVLILIFAATLHWLPFSGMFDDLPPDTIWGYIPIVLRHMILPTGAIFLSTFFQMVYTWRVFFLIHSGEDYVELGIMKGLPPHTLERRYLLRPVLPAIMTSFILLLTSFWQNSLMLEYIFDWPGIGDLFISAVRSNVRSMSVSILILYAYSLAAVVFFLDILYALVDPRVRFTLPQSSHLVKNTPKLQITELFKTQLSSWLQALQSWRPGLPSVATVTASLDKLDLGAFWGRTQQMLRKILRYPSAVVGIAGILALMATSLYAVVTIPYEEAVLRWRIVRPDSYTTAANARPLYFNWFRKSPLPPTIHFDSAKDQVLKTREQTSETTTRIELEFMFDFPYEEVPQDLMLRFSGTYELKKPFVTLEWVTPDGRSLNLGDFSVVDQQDYLLSQDIPKRYLSSRGMSQQTVFQGTGGAPPITLLFADPRQETPVVIPGQYTLRIHGLVFEPGGDIDAEMVLYGQVEGWAGTDHRRRDLLTALLWGAPLALAFGVIGALGTTTLALVLAAVAAWFGGRWAQLIQLLNEVNQIIPALPIAIMVYYLYSKSVWAVLSVFMLLNVFGGALRTYYAAFLQLKEAPYIEAAKAYGVSHVRMIIHYLLPRMIPNVIPQLVVMAPAFVFFEASLAFLNFSDPYLPTWGKVIYDAMTVGAFGSSLYWIFQPLALLLGTALCFALLGFALERIFDPRLRDT